MKILIACEYSGRVRDAFAALGHDAMSCDFLPSEQPGKHYQGDVRDVLGEQWDLLIAHPDCTYLTNAGVCHLHKDPKRWPRLFDAAEFFKLFLNADHIPMLAVENPIMHKYAKTLIGGVKQSQVIQPWMFGHMEQKATCLWLKGLNPLKPTNIVKGEMMLLPKNQRERLYYLPPSADRWKERSRTYQGIADAMAMQWGRIENQQDLFGGALMSTFKVGDKIIFAAMGNSVMEYQQCLEMFISQGLIRHATPEEIAAGHRIESSNDQAISDCSLSNLCQNDTQNSLTIKQENQDMGDSHIENHIIPNCKVGVK